MSISISGLGSGLPVDTWIEKLLALKQAKIDEISQEKTFAGYSSSALSTIKTSFNTLLSSMQKVTDSRFGSTSDLFAQKTATSSDSNILTASVTALASKQTVSVSVSQLASSTVAKSVNTASAKMTGTTTVSSLANGGVTEGNFSVYVNNTKYSISVASTDTLNNILGRINSQTGMSATVTDGKITISDPAQTANIVVGSNSDTTNFANIVALKKNAQGAYVSNQSVLLANTSANLTSANAGFAQQINTSSFKIGNATFNVDSSTTLNGLIYEINNSEDAGVNAYWDTGAGKLVLTSKTTGASNINVQNLSGNFTDVMGLTASTFNPDGSIATTKLADNTQTLGNLATLTINGTSMISSSNTITSDISGITGLTLNLKSINTEETPTTTITIETNNSSLNSAISDFISNFNEVIANVDEATGSDGYLNGESVLVSIRNNLRMTATASVDIDGNYKTLASIGITTGAVGSDINANTNQLQIDSTKLAAALADDPDAVKKLLLGDDTHDGVFKKLESIIDSSMDSSYGYFTTRSATLSENISDLTDTITKKTEELGDYKIELQDKFNQMDQLIATLQNQYSKVISALSTITSNSSS
ncbi:MAG TPA: flagellar filament capping protein FliD [Candidatus Gastranaerophilaceae bacterium]|nr:flagellar filament capping protein FliD [Candidatus Gastranaerophilaceae bacterium]HPT41428.1 flagellar filament capping protein FliD [Candidatus Gastranaerophilaceae bacterium]